MTEEIRRARTVHIAHIELRKRQVITTLLETLGHEIKLSTDSGRELIQRSIDSPPDIIISAPLLSDFDGIEALVQIGEKQPCPSIVVAKTDDLDKVERAMEDHVMAYLVEPVSAEDLQPAIYLAERRFQKIRALEATVDELRQQLEVRKLTEKAKGLLMEKRGLSEAEAHRLLQKTARQKRKTMKDIAQAILDADLLLEEEA